MLFIRVKRQSVRGNKSRFPKPNIINPILSPFWFKAGTNCKYDTDTFWVSVSIAGPLNGEHSQWEKRSQSGDVASLKIINQELNKLSSVRQIV